MNKLERFFLNSILKTTSRVSKYKSGLFTAGVVKSLSILFAIFFLQLWLFFLSFTTIFMKPALRNQLDESNKTSQTGSKE